MVFSGVAQQAEEAENSATSTNVNNVSADVAAQTDGALVVSVVGNDQSGSCPSHGIVDVELRPDGDTELLTTIVSKDGSFDTMLVESWIEGTYTLSATFNGGLIGNVVFTLGDTLTSDASVYSCDTSDCIAIESDVEEELPWCLHCNCCLSRKPDALYKLFKVDSSHNI